MTEKAKPPREEMIARARALIPTLRERAPGAEAAGRLPDETINDLHEMGLWRVNQPARVGGGEYDYKLVVDIASELSRGCGSTGWVYVNLAVHHWMLAMWPPEAQDLVWDGNPNALIASSVIYPSGSAVAIDGGYELTGRWPFCSGILHSQWVMVGALAKKSAEDQPEPRLFLVPVDDLEVIDTWDVMGLCATGSQDIACQGIEVNAKRTVAAASLRGNLTPGSVVNRAPVFRQSVAGLFPHLIAAVLIGIARGTWDLCIEGMRARSARSSGRKISELVPVQNRVAEAGTQIDTARAILGANFEESRLYAEVGEMPPVEAKLRWRRDGAFAARLACDATLDLHRTKGASGIYNQEHVQRHIRDVTVGMTHAHVSWEINGPAYGRVALGLKCDNPLI